MKKQSSPCSLYCPGVKDICSACGIHKHNHSPRSIMNTYPKNYKSPVAKRNDRYAAKKALQEFFDAATVLVDYAEKYGLDSLEGLATKPEKKKLIHLFSRMSAAQVANLKNLL